MPDPKFANRTLNCGDMINVIPIQLLEVFHVMAERYIYACIFIVTVEKSDYRLSAANWNGEKALHNISFSAFYGPFCFTDSYPLR